MNIVQEKNFQQALDTLDDLVRLGPTELRPCISQLEYYLNSLKYDDSLTTKGNYLNSFFLQHVEKEIMNYFLLGGVDSKEINLKIEIKELSFEKWSNILDITPLIINYLKIFKFDSFIDLTVTDSSFVLTTEFNSADELLKNRKDIYYYSRKLIEKKVIPTYKVGLNEKGSETLNLVFDFGHDPKIFYCLDFVNTHGLVLKLSNSLENYYLDFNQDICEKKHLCVVINEDLSVDKSYRIPKRFIDNSKYELLHFPFLFRPVSLIIPVKGFLTTDIGIRQLVDTGSVNQSLRQDVDKSTIGVSVHSVDFFSLLVEA